MQKKRFIAKKKASLFSTQLSASLNISHKTIFILSGIKSDRLALRIDLFKEKSCEFFFCLNYREPVFSSG